jgi:hypothetical protein
MQIPFINAYKDDEEFPFDTCLEKGISDYIPWKRIGKYNHENIDLKKSIPQIAPYLNIFILQLNRKSRKPLTKSIPS